MFSCKPLSLYKDLNINKIRPTLLNSLISLATMLVNVYTT